MQVLLGKFTRLFLKIVTITTVPLSFHIYLQSLVGPKLAALENGLQYPGADEYSIVFLFFVYLTAIISFSVYMFIYYHCGHLLRIKNKLIKSMALSLIKLELNQSLIREPFMNWLMHKQVGADKPFLIMILRSLDVWIPNLICSTLIVYLVKTKYQSKKHEI